jgi:hypothetical protein
MTLYCFEGKASKHGMPLTEAIFLISSVLEHEAFASKELSVSELFLHIRPPVLRRRIKKRRHGNIFA